MKSGLINKLLMICFIANSFSCTKPPCECDFIPHQYIEVKFLNSEGQNLIFGPDAVFAKDGLHILDQKDNFDINNASIQKGLNYSSSLQLSFYIPSEKNYIYYNQQTPEDSLEIKWVTKTGKCCGNPQEYTIVDSVKFRNV